MSNMKKIDSKIKEELSSQLSLAEYMLWIDQLVPYSYENNELIYSTPNQYVCTTIKNNYLNKFLEVIKKLKLPVNNISFITESNISSNNINTTVVSTKENQFNPKYTFDSFVMAESNRLALEASMTVAKNPGSHDKFLTLNPLYIYGGVGLGKTHLLHAIGNYLYENYSNLNVIYSTFEKIANEYFDSLNKYANDKEAYRNFRQKYASCDVLIIDDIQFMQKKGGVQDQFFNIFNDLYNNDKQIIISSDKPPKEINDIEERLSSRFEMGLMTDISAPSFDTRVNIIYKKLESINITIDPEIINFIAETIDTNIRELEGALNKVIMLSYLKGTKPDMEITREALKEKLENSSEALDSDKIIKAVSNYYRIPVAEIIGRKKTKDIAEARQISIYLICESLSLPLVSIGNIFGRDHSTISYSRDQIYKLVKEDERIRKIVEDVKATINGL